MSLEKFELGKCYRHSSGREMFICGVVDTVLYGTCFAAEENRGQNLSPIAMNSEDAICNWTEIPKEEYIAKNYS